MRAWIVDRPGPIKSRPLQLVELPDPHPAPGQVRLRVLTCGVCRTDLHLLEGDLPPRRAGVVPGHEVVGVVDEIGEGSSRFRLGDHVGVPWLARTDGSCRFCRRGDENLCESPTFTGWDVNGGYADYCCVDERFGYGLPGGLDEIATAPLLCAGIIGYRALLATAVRPGGALGIYGFGGSAHLTAQVALHLGMRVHVLTRGAANREMAASLGVDSGGAASRRTPEPTARRFWRSPGGWASGRPRTRTTCRKPIRRWRISRPGRSMVPPSCARRPNRRRQRCGSAHPSATPHTCGTSG